MVDMVIMRLIIKNLKFGFSIFVWLGLDVRTCLVGAKSKLLRILLKEFVQLRGRV